MFALLATAAVAVALFSVYHLMAAGSMGGRF
jgi:hypothetical protein